MWKIEVSAWIDRYLVAVDVDLRPCLQIPGALRLMTGHGLGKRASEQHRCVVVGLALCLRRT